MPEHLWAPWRFNYVTEHKTKVCIFCRALKAKRDKEHFVLHRGKDNFIILNLYPYNNGHLMIAPNLHIESLEKSSPEQLQELMIFTRRSIEMLKSVYHPHGFNMGMNLGAAGGAGVADHYHMHVVPRWQGDTNYMTVMGDTRVIPESPDETYAKLKPFFSKI